MEATKKTKQIEERRKAIMEYAKEYRRDQIPYLVPKQLWRNVLLDVVQVGQVEIRLFGDDYLDDGKVKRIELRLGEPVMLSKIKEWLREGLLKAMHFVLALNKAVEPPRVSRVSEEDEIKKLKEMLAYIEDMKKKYLGGRE
jgi:hypothetical protein